jgi:hypothetical protein
MENSDEGNWRGNENQAVTRVIENIFRCSHYKSLSVCSSQQHFAACLRHAASLAPSLFLLKSRVGRAKLGLVGVAAQARQLSSLWPAPSLFMKRGCDWKPASPGSTLIKSMPRLFALGALPVVFLITTYFL